MGCKAPLRSCMHHGSERNGAMAVIEEQSVPELLPCCSNRATSAPLALSPWPPQRRSDSPLPPLPVPLAACACAQGSAHPQQTLPSLADCTSLFSLNSPMGLLLLSCFSGCAHAHAAAVDVEGVQSSEPSLAIPPMTAMDESAAQRQQTAIAPATTSCRDKLSAIGAAAAAGGAAAVHAPKAHKARSPLPSAQRRFSLQQHITQLQKEMKEEPLPSFQWRNSNGSSASCSLASSSTYTASTYSARSSIEIADYKQRHATTSGSRRVSVEYLHMQSRHSTARSVPLSACTETAPAQLPLAPSCPPSVAAAASASPYPLTLQAAAGTAQAPGMAQCRAATPLPLRALAVQPIPHTDSAEWCVGAGQPARAPAAPVATLPPTMQPSRAAATAAAGASAPVPSLLRPAHTPAPVAGLRDLQLVGNSSTLQPCGAAPPCQGPLKGLFGNASPTPACPPAVSTCPAPATRGLAVGSGANPAHLSKASQQLRSTTSPVLSPETITLAAWETMRASNCSDDGTVSSSSLAAPSGPTKPCRHQAAAPKCVLHGNGSC